MLKKLTLCAIILSVVVTGIDAQENINTTGGNASGDGGSGSYSVGQIVYSVNAGTTGFEIQGVQQPYEITVISSIEEFEDITLSVYPNPTIDFLKVNFESEKLKDLSFHLVDLNGKIIQNQKITGNLTTINMSNLAPATYFLIINEENKEIKIFKIIKN